MNRWLKFDTSMFTPMEQAILKSFATNRGHPVITTSARVITIKAKLTKHNIDFNIQFITGKGYVYNG